MSLHLNSYTTGTPCGTEVYYYNDVSMNGLTSDMIAEYFRSNLVNAMETTNRGIKKKAWSVHRNCSVPAVLIELAFLSNTDETGTDELNDYEKLISSEYQQIAAETIYDTITQIFEDYSTGR